MYAIITENGLFWPISKKFNLISLKNSIFLISQLGISINLLLLVSENQKLFAVLPKIAKFWRRFFLNLSFTSKVSSEYLKIRMEFMFLSQFSHIRIAKIKRFSIFKICNLQNRSQPGFRSHIFCDQSGS